MWCCSACLYEEGKCYCKHGSFVEIADDMEIGKRKGHMVENWDGLAKREKGFKKFVKPDDSTK